MAHAKPLDINALLERLEMARKQRRPFERDWYLNLAYIAGEQYVNWAFDPANRIVAREFEPEDTIHPVHNICVKIYRTERSKLLKNLPVPMALPVTDDEDDMYAARIVDAYFRYLRDEWNYEQRLRMATSWLVPAGNVWFKWYWAGGNQMAVISPFDIYCDPYAKTPADCRWIIHSQFMDEETAKELYDGLSEADLGAIRSTATDTLSPLEGRLYSMYGTEAGQNLPGVTLHEYWEPPSKICPEGRFIVFSDHGIVLSQKFPYAHGRMPFTHAGHIQRANSKFCGAPLDYVRPIQDELNRAEKQIIENRNISNGIWFIPTEVTLSTAITAEPRQVIEWEGPPGLDPRNWFVQPQGMANWVAGEPARLKDTAQDIVAQHEVSNAGVPGRVESGQAIQLLQETDDSVMRDVTDSLDEAIADGFLMSALLHKQFGPPETLVRVYDKNGGVEVQHLTRDMVDLNMRVKTQVTTGLPQTIAGKWDRVLNLVQYQIITPERAIELLDLTTESPELAPDTQDRKNAYRENKRMAAGEIVRAKIYDDHDVHLDEHDRYRKTEEYRQLVEADPTIEDKFGFHDEEHKMLRAQRDQEEATREAAIQALLGQGQDTGGGGGGPKGAPMPQPPEPAPNGSPAPVAS